MFDLISNSMIYLLELLKGVVGNYGWAIIGLTILVRLVLWPVSKAQVKSMQVMQALQPKMKTLQERYKADPQRMQQEMMKLYQEHKFNPLGGCLPMLIQLPLFIGLYWAISSPHFLQVMEPPFLGVVHLNHTGIISHAGASADGQMALGENPQGSFFGIGRDALASAPKMTLKLKDGKTIENQAVPNPNSVITFLPKQLHAGMPVKLSTSFEKLGLEGYEDTLAAVTLTVINNATKETETVELTPTEKYKLGGSLETVQGKTVPHWDILLLVIIFAVSMLASQKQMAGQAVDSGNGQQQQMMKMMSIMFIGLLFVFPIPAGVLLYMDTNSVFQVVQTWIFNRANLAGVVAEAPGQQTIDVQPSA